MGQRTRRLNKARPSFILALLFLLAITMLMNVLIWILYVQNLRPWLGGAGVNAYLVFSCVGFVILLLGAGPLIYWPYSHGDEMSPVARRNTFCLGIIVCFFIHHFPITWMEIWIVRSLGWTQVLQGISLILTVICFAIGFFTTWFAYTWKLSKVLQIRFGDAAPSRAPVPTAPLSHVSAASQI